MPSNKVPAGFLKSLTISHDRRGILHFNVTRHPTSGWIVQQLREAFLFGATPRFLIHDQDAKYGAEGPAAIRSLDTNPVRTSFRVNSGSVLSRYRRGSCPRYEHHFDVSCMEAGVLACRQHAHHRRQPLVKCRLKLQAAARKIPVSFGGRHFGELQPAKTTHQQLLGRNRRPSASA